MFVPVQNLAWLIYPFYCFIRIFRSFVLWFKRTFEEMCFTVQLSMFFAVSATASVFYHVVFALSRTFLTFFRRSFSVLFRRKQLWYFIMLFWVCQELFSSFLKKFFQFFVSHKQLLYDTIHFSVCQQLFLLFSSFYRCVLQAVFSKLNVKDVILDI